MLSSMKNGVGLGGAYDATLERVKAQDGEKTKLAMATLMWVCHSERPLQVDELCHALAVEIGSADFDPDNVPLMATLLGCCQGLITVDKEASTVRLIHYTLREYLSAYPDLSATAHSTIAETCLTYLNAQQVRELPPYPPPDDQRMPFLNYSSQHWGIHAKKEFSDCTMSIALELLSGYEGHVSAISLLRQSRGGYDFGGSSLFSGLHCASFFGIVELVTIFMGGEVGWTNQRNRTGATPLLWAARNGHEEVVGLLLDQENVNPDSPNTNGRTPLQHAARNGHENVVKLLLKQENVNINSYDIKGITSLVYPATGGHDAVVKLLLEREDIIPDWQDNRGGTALWGAVAFGTEEIVKLLLEREDVDPNLSDNDGGTPLSGLPDLDGKPL